MFESARRGECRWNSHTDLVSGCVSGVGGSCVGCDLQPQGPRSRGDCCACTSPLLSPIPAQHTFSGVLLITATAKGCLHTYIKGDNTYLKYCFTAFYNYLCFWGYLHLLYLYSGNTIKWYTTAWYCPWWRYLHHGIGKCSKSGLDLLFSWLFRFREVRRKCLWCGLNEEVYLVCCYYIWIVQNWRNVLPVFKSHYTIQQGNFSHPLQIGEVWHRSCFTFILSLIWSDLCICS